MRLNPPALKSALFALAAAMLFTGLPPAPLHAASFAPALYSGLHWRHIGPFQAGRTTAVAGVPGQPNVFYMGAVDGGVWKTVNAGWTWKPIFDEQPIASIGAIAVAPSDANVIYVGTGEADPRSQISYGNGMYKSTDAGKTWTHIGLGKTRHIGFIVVDPHDPNRLFVAALGNLYAANPERGVYESNDGGASWSRVLFKNADTGAIDLAFDPRDPQTIYAALWQVRRPPWVVYPPANGPGSGLYKSTDGGATWKQLGHGLPTADVGRIGVAVAPGNPDRVYAIVDAKAGGLYRSDDAGATWARTDDDPRIWGRQWYFGHLTVDPKDQDTLYVMNTTTYRSTDGGANFVAWKGAPSGNDYRQLWINPDDSDIMGLSSDMLGVVITLDGGKTWSSWNNQPTSQFYHVYADNQYPYWVGGAVQDTGGHAVASDVATGRLTYRDRGSACTGGESNQVVVDPLSVAELYGLGFGGPVKCNNLTGASEDISPLLAYPETVFRHPWTTPVAFSMADKHAFYFANQFMWKTDDGGDTWRKFSPDLSRQHPGIPTNLGAVAAADTTYEQRTLGPRWGVIYSIAPSPLEAGTVWAGTDDGLIWVTRDDGKHWNDVTPKPLTAWSKVIMMDASHFDAGTAYAGVDRHRLDDYTPHVFRTRDGGKSWQEVDDGLPTDAYVQAVKQDPGRRGMLWAGTSVGVYVSFDEGDHWQSLRLNMPVVEIRDFAFKDDAVAIATFGRGLWVLDDLSPLHELDAGVAAASVHLFKPEAAHLPQPHTGFAMGTSLAVAADIDPLDIWSGEPRAKGAFIDYYLKADAAGPVTLEVLDADGKVVRRYSSSATQPAPDPKALSFPAGWIRAPAPLLATAGMHRFAWDLRVVPPGTPPATGMLAFLGGSGHEAIPGTYTVKLTVDGQSQVQPLSLNPPVEVKHEQAVPYDAASKLAQIQLLGSIQELQSRVGDAARAAARLRQQLGTLEGQVGGSLASSIKALDAKAKEVYGYAPPPSPRASGVGDGAPAWDSLQGLGTTLSGLAFAAQQGGMRPPKQALVTGVDKTGRAADATLAKWNELAAKEIPALDARLQKAGLPPLAAGNPPAAGRAR